MWDFKSCCSPIFVALIWCFYIFNLGPCQACEFLNFINCPASLVLKCESSCLLFVTGFVDQPNSLNIILLASSQMLAEKFLVIWNGWPQWKACVGNVVQLCPFPGNAGSEILASHSGRCGTQGDGIPRVLGWGAAHTSRCPDSHDDLLVEPISCQVSQANVNFRKIVS